MTRLALTITPIPRGWTVALTDGRHIARFAGPGAKLRALRYLERYVKDIGGNVGSEATAHSRGYY